MEVELFKKINLKGIRADFIQVSISKIQEYEFSIKA